MKNKLFLALFIIICGLPVFSYSSVFEEVLNKAGNYSWTVEESQVLLKEYTGDELEEYLQEWNNGGNTQKLNKLTIVGKPEKSYNQIYFKPCKALVMQNVEGDTYVDHFRMKGIVVGSYQGADKVLHSQELNTKNVTFANFLNAVTNKGGNVTFSNTDFIKNKATTDGAKIDGGAVYNESGLVTVKDNSNFLYNKASSGGAIYNKSELVVKNSTIGGQHNEGIYYIMESPTYHINTSNLSDEELALIHSLPDSEVTYRVDGYLGSDDWIIIYYLVPEWKDIRAINWPEESQKGFFNSQWVHIYPLGNEALYGAGIYNDGKATITGTNFKYNIAKKDENGLGGYGGGIYNKGDLSVLSSKFYYNKAIYGGGIYSDTGNDKNVVIQNSDFTSNRADFGAGVYIKNGNLTFKNDVFGAYGQNPSNKAVYGGAVYNEKGVVDIISSSFSNNYAEKGGDIYNKGIISISKSNFGLIPRTYSIFYGIHPIYTVKNGETFVEDTTTYIVNPLEYPDIKIEPIKYIVASSALQGGAIYNKGEITSITSSTFNETTAIEGGAIYNDNDGIISLIKNSKFNSVSAKNPDENTDNSALGGAIYNKGIIKSENNSFVSNSAVDAGGVLYNRDGAVDFESSEFSGNYSAYGGVMYVFSGEVNVAKSTYSGNYAEAGGAVFVDNEGLVNINSSVFVLNKAYKDAEENTEGESAVTELTDGGAIYNKGELNLNKVVFGDKKKKYKYSNTAKNGSALFNVGTANLNEVDIIYHEAENGVVYNKGELDLIRSSIFSNKTKAGALYAEKDSVTKVFGADFKSNESENGGAVCSDGNLQIGNAEYTVIKKKKLITKTQQTSFISNSATEAGGAIYLDKDSSGNISDAKFTSNKAYSTKTETETDSDNKTQTITISPVGAGGAMYIVDSEQVKGDEPPVEITINSKFTSNSAGAKGGAISIGNNRVVEIKGSTFEKNSAYSLVTIKKYQLPKKGYYKKLTIKPEITKTYAGNGGAVFIGGNSNVFVNSSKFINNKAVNGGGIYVSAYEKPPAEENQNDESGDTVEDETEANHIKVNNSEFKSNTAISGGAVYNAGYLDIKDSTFEQNTASGEGGVVFNEGFLTIDTSNFDNNVALYGGVLFNIGEAEIRKTNFNNTKRKVCANGGSIYNVYKLKIMESKFNKNMAQQGGAIYNSVIKYSSYTIQGDITSKNNEYTENQAGVGGVVYNDYKFSSENDTFTKNVANYGGAILNRGTLNITSATFDTNSSAIGGAIYNVGTVEKIKDTVFKSNKSNSGGAIYNQSKLTVEGGEFNENQSYYGGAIYSVSSVDSDNKTVFSEVNINGTTFNKNRGNVYGGALYLAGNYTKIDGATFNENSAEYYGGAIIVGNSTDTIKINQTTFEGNYTGMSGGAIFNSGNMEFNIVPESESSTDSQTEEIKYNPVLFKSNKSDNGGAIYNVNVGVIKADNTDFKENTVTCHGGAIYNEGYIELSDATFISNKAESKTLENKGGAIYNNPIYPTKQNEDGDYEYDTDVKRGMKISGSGFGGNIADNGGAVYNTGLLDAENSVFGGTAYDIDPETGERIEIVFDGNVANKSGGAIYNKGIMTTKNTAYCKNQANYGGAIFNENYLLVGDNVTEESQIEWDPSKQNNIFNTNSANANGGAIYSAKSDTAENYYLLVNGGFFINNKAEKNGGAIYTTAQGTVANTTFAYNAAEENGGAIYASASYKDMKVVEAEFINNAAKNGGAIYSDSGTKLTINMVDFQGNSAQDNGGAIYIGKDSKSVSIKDTNFINNTAGKLGGAIYIEDGAYVTIEAVNRNVTFDGNKANGESNAIYLNGSTVGNILLMFRANSKKIMVNDAIDGRGSIIATGDVYFGNYAQLKESADISLVGGKGTVGISNENNFMSLSLSLSGETNLNIANGGIRTLALKTLSLANDTMNDVAIDVDLKNKTSDKITAETVEGRGKLNVSSIHLTSNSKAPVEIKVGEDSLVDSVSVDKAETAEATYKLKTSLRDGLLTTVAYGQKAKPCALAAPVAAQLGGYLTQINSYDQAFMNMDMNMGVNRQEREARDMANKYAYSGNDVLYTDNGMNPNGKGLWTRPYATFERVNLSHGPKVGNIAYGNFFGGDADIKQLRNGWTRQFSAYIGYNGSVQDFNGQSVDQNGGTIGITEVWYRRNFFTGLTANVSANAVNASTDIGHENFPMLMAGIASKTGYNFEFKQGKFIIQPSILLSYSFVHTFSHNNGKGMHVGSSPLSAIQVAPGIKFIANLPKGWQPYMAVNMRWNILDKTHFSLPDVSIPDMSVDPYVEYGLGVQRKWGERFTGYGQAMIRNGGRNGIMLSFGFKWALGR